MIWKRFSFSNFLNTAEASLSSSFIRPEQPLISLDLNKLVTYQKREQSVVVRVDSDVERYEHIKEDQGMDHCSAQRSIQDKHREGVHSLAKGEHAKEQGSGLLSPSVSASFRITWRKGLASEDGVK